MAKLERVLFILIALFSLAGYTASAQVAGEITQFQPSTQLLSWISGAGHLVIDGTGYHQISPKNLWLPKPVSDLPVVFAPLGLFTIGGTNLCPAKALEFFNSSNIAFTTPKPKVIAGCRVLVDGTAVPLTMAFTESGTGQSRLDGQLPNLKTGKHNLVVQQVREDGAVITESNTVEFTVAPVAPSLVRVEVDVCNCGMHTWVDQRITVKVGGYGLLWATNFGLTEPVREAGETVAEWDDKVFPNTPEFDLAVQFPVMGKLATLALESSFATMSARPPGVGVYYMYFRIPDSAPLPDKPLSGPNATLIISFKGEVVGRVPFYLQ